MRLTLLIAAFAGGCLIADQAAAAPAGCVAITNVTVVATDHPGLTPHTTVVARHGVIASVGAAGGPILAGCQRIDGRDRYLIPGLVDSHVHLFGYSRGGEGDLAAEQSILRMLLANGVTTAVVMEGSPATLRARDAVRAGLLVGPTLYTAGPLIQAPDTGAPPGRRTFATAEDVQREVEEEKQLGYDFVKVHGAMPSEAYAALLATARRVGLPVVGHIPDNLGVDAALTGDQKMIAHAESYLQTDFEFHRKLPTDPAETAEMVKEVAAKTAKAGVYVQPTLSVFSQIIRQVADPDSLLQRPETSLLPSVTTADWGPDRNPYLRHWTAQDLAGFRAEYRVMQALVRGLRDAGVPLLVGTDDLVPMQLPGFAMRDEMEQMQEAGLTPFEVLRAATATSARFLGEADRSGAIRPGYAADLVLLDANPLEAVSNLFRQSGVMLRGQWNDEASLQRALWAPTGDGRTGVADRSSMLAPRRAVRAR